MIIAIDGPAGAGKSTTARAVARRFGLAYIDTGAMYRAVALATMEHGLQAGRDDEQIIELAQGLPLALKEQGQRIFIGERDVSQLIRTPQIGEMTSAISTIAGVREVIVAQQRRLGSDSESDCGGAVLEGRDIQTVVFPDAPVKIFLTADPRTRAARRLAQWQQTDTANAGIALDEAERDSNRQVSPLRAAPDAVVLPTDNLSEAQVIERIAQIIEAKMVEGQ